MFDLEHAIAEWRRQLLAAGIKSLATLDELENHLREQFAQLDASGSTEAERFQIAVTRLGQTDALKREFAKVKRPLSSRLRDNPPRLIFLAAWFLLMGLDGVGTVARCLNMVISLWWLTGIDWMEIATWSGFAILMGLQFFTGIGLLLRQNRWRWFAIFLAVVNVSFSVYMIMTHIMSLDDFRAGHPFPLFGFMVSVRYSFVLHYCNLLVMIWALWFLPQRSTRALFQADRPTKIA